MMGKEVEGELLHACHSLFACVISVCPVGKGGREGEGDRRERRLHEEGKGEKGRGNRVWKGDHVCLFVVG